MNELGVRAVDSGCSVQGSLLAFADLAVSSGLSCDVCSRRHLPRAVDRLSNDGILTA